MDFNNLLRHPLLFRAYLRQMFLYFFKLFRIRHFHHSCILLEQQVPPLRIRPADIFHVTFQDLVFVYHPLAHPHAEKCIGIFLAGSPASRIINMLEHVPLRLYDIEYHLLLFCHTCLCRCHCLLCSLLHPNITPFHYFFE